MTQNDYLELKLQIMKTHGLNETLVAFIRLQFQFGLRVGDLLKIKREDITSDYIIYVKQSKRSLPLILHLSSDFEFWEKYKKGLYPDISLFNKKYFYDLYKRYGLQIVNETGHNASVTHSARKLLAQKTFNETNSVEITQTVLGHKSQNSTLYYLSDTQKKTMIEKGILSNVSGTINNMRFSTRYGKTIARLLK